MVLFPLFTLFFFPADTKRVTQQIEIFHEGNLVCFVFTPPKINMEPGNDGFQ